MSLHVQFLGSSVRPVGADFFPAPDFTLDTCPQGAGERHEFSLSPGETVVAEAIRLSWRLTFPAGAPLRVHHHVLPRLHGRMTLPADQRLGSEGLPRTGFSSPGNYSLPAGHQDMALHNAFVAFQPEGPAWLLAPLSEERAKAGYTWTLRDPRTLEVAVEYVFLGLPGWAIGAGTTFLGESLYAQSFASPVRFGPELFDDYHATLLARGGLGRIRTGANSRHELFWGTWNEGIHYHIDEALILREARWIAANLPGVRWIQIDAGFHRDADRDPAAASNLGGHATPGEIECPRRFPRGLRALAADIRALGLRPMIWFSPSCSRRGAFFQADPDYFIPNSTLHFEDNLVFPDLSLPAVRDELRRALDRLFVDWGFEGIKLDFWTYGFEQARMKLRHHQASNLEWLHWLEREIRLRLPADGLMLSCLEPANGNPFRSAVWDQHRIGPDIDGVTLATMEEIAIWMAALVGLKQTQRHFWVPDVDGLSLFRHHAVGDERWRLFTTFMIVTGGATELAGKLSEQADDPRMPVFRRAVALARLGEPVVCPAYDWVENAGRAPLVWVRRDRDGRRVLGFTNWDNTPRRLACGAADLDVPPDAVLVNVFTGESALLPLVRTVGSGDAELWSYTP